MAKVIQRRALRVDDWLFVGEIDGQLASVALLERDGDTCRVDEVHTDERYRGRGCARAVMHALLGYHNADMEEPLFLWIDNPIAERIYVEAGSRRLEDSS